MKNASAAGAKHAHAATSPPTTRPTGAMRYLTRFCFSLWCGSVSLRGCRTVLWVRRVRCQQQPAEPTRGGAVYVLGVGGGGNQSGPIRTFQKCQEKNNPTTCQDLDLSAAVTPARVGHRGNRVYRKKSSRLLFDKHVQRYIRAEHSILNHARCPPN